MLNKFFENEPFIASAFDILMSTTDDACPVYMPIIFNVTNFWQSNKKILFKKTAVIKKTAPFFTSIFMSSANN